MLYLLIFVYHILSIFLMLQVLLFPLWLQNFSLTLFRVDLPLINCLTFPSSEQVLISPLFQKWVKDSVLIVLSAPKKHFVTSFSPLCFWREIHCHSNHCSTLGRILFLFGYFQDFFSSSLVFGRLACVFVWISLGFSCLGFVLIFESVGLCLSPNLRSFQS